ncbi:flagellar hook-length control protein FliK [Azospirillum humicireducens]|uniref:Flagellar hook-length control protein FliK n=1 Tax=Azospirillum humicireducens TaxID=1226968 RepID=A0A161JBN4_9PROT|nr:flagellar hook-length control protein FliK [Azospirillum humicireducens]ANC92701.1 flagellar hook-length control protein FliK [Azospirillum humicireducens]
MAGHDLVPPQVPPPDLLAARFAAMPAAMPAAAGETGDGPDAGPVVRRLLDLLDTLAPVESALARGCLPRCDSTFGAGLALFLAATADGCRGWIAADAAAELSGLDGGLLIDECERALAPRFQPVEGRVWRLSRVPLLEGGDGLLCAVGMEDGPSDRVTLVLQARPPRLGPVQLMATLGGRRLDVTLRLATGLPSSALADLHESFRAALADCRIDGVLTVGPLADAWLGLDRPLSSDIAL